MPPLTPSSDEEYFTHARPEAGQPTQFSPLTRYLCGASYLDQRFGDLVIAELIGNGNRAVVPAIGYDVEPVIRHAYRARLLWLLQNLAITAVLVASLLIATVPTLVLLGLALALALPGLLSETGRRPSRKWLVVVVGGILLVLCAGGPLFALLSGELSDDDYDYDDYGYPEPDSGLSGNEAIAAPLVGALVIGAIILTVITAFRTSTLRTIVNELAPGKVSPGPAVRGERIGQRLATVAAAQHGNVVLHSTYSPFLGAGPVTGAWSMALELKRDPDAGPGRDGDQPPDDQRDARPVAVDPVELNRFLKRRLAALQSEELLERERMVGLTLRDQIMSTGAQWHHVALVDENRRLPYSRATPEAIRAIVRHPQASARHFLRATIGADVRSVTETGGRVIMPGEYQQVVVSTFTHLAVEGGMLYLENVTTVLGPLRQSFLDIDQYWHRGEQSDIAATAFLESVRALPAAIVLAPVNLVRSIAGSIAMSRQLNRAEREAREEPVYDFGARAEVRELASLRLPSTYLQRLDAEKYSKLLERRISEAVIEFLREHGIDTSEYETRMNVYNNSGVMISGGNYGAVAAGAGANAVLRQAAQTTAQPKESR